MKDTVDSISTSQESLKDRKIIELAKKNRALQTQVETLKTKCASAAKIAIQLNEDKNNETQQTNN